MVEKSELLQDFHSYWLGHFPGFELVSNERGISQLHNSTYDFFVNPFLGQILNGIDSTERVYSGDLANHFVSFLGLYNYNGPDIQHPKFKLIDGYLINNQMVDKIFSRLTASREDSSKKEIFVRRADLSDLFSGRTPLFHGDVSQSNRFLFKSISIEGSPIKGVLLEKTQGEKVKDGRVIDFLADYKLL